MKSLVKFLNESLLNEAFFDYDTALEKVPAKMQDVEKLKVLIKKFTKFGEEDDYEDGKGPYERLINNLKYNEKQYDALNKIKNLVKYNDPYETKIAARAKYCDKMFSLVKSDLDKDAKKYGSADYEYLITALAGCADYIVNYSGMKGEDADKYLGKLANKFNKVFGVDANGFTKISQKYDGLKVGIQKAIDVETKTVESVNVIKNQFKEHKYTIFCGSHESAAEIYIIDNSKYETLDDAFENSVAKETSGSSVANYNLDEKLRNLIKDGKVNALYLCLGYYCWGEDKDNTIPTFGYFDEIPSMEIYKYSGYDSKYYYSGKLQTNSKLKTKGDIAYHWYDSLWSVHSRD